MKVAEPRVDFLLVWGKVDYFEWIVSLRCILIFECNPVLGWVLLFIVVLLSSSTNLFSDVLHFDAGAKCFYCSISRNGTSSTRLKRFQYSTWQISTVETIPVSVITGLCDNRTMTIVIRDRFFSCLSSHPITCRRTIPKKFIWNHLFQRIMKVFFVFAALFCLANSVVSAGECEGTFRRDERLWTVPTICKVISCLKWNVSPLFSQQLVPLFIIFSLRESHGWGSCVNEQRGQ